MHHYSHTNDESKYFLQVGCFYYELFEDLKCQFNESLFYVSLKMPSLEIFMWTNVPKKTNKNYLLVSWKRPLWPNSQNIYSNFYLICLK